MSTYFKNGMMPYNRTSAIVSLSSALVIVVLYIFFTDFFINASVLIALLFPIFVVTYYLIRVVDNSLSILMG
jgi:predicted membrane protein